MQASCSTTHRPISKTYQRAIAIFDSRVDDLTTLLTGLLPDIEAIVLHPHEDGITQLSALFEKRRGIEQLYLIGHGAPGLLQLGRTNLDHAALGAINWHGALAKDVNIAVYGCAIAAGNSGRDWIAQLHAATGASVAASRHELGNGHWHLEATLGETEPGFPFTEGIRHTYQHIFSLSIVNFNRPSFWGIESREFIDSLLKNEEVVLLDTDVLVENKIELVRSEPSENELFVKIRLAQGTATLGEDFQGLGDEDIAYIIAYFPPGSRGASVDLSSFIVNDSVLEPVAETLNLSISMEDGTALVGDQATATFNLIDNELTLTFIEAEFEGAENGRALTFSPDGKFAFAAHNDSTLVSVFQRDPETGEITLIPALKDAIEGLPFANSITLSPDGKFLYLSGGNSLAVLAWDSVDESLTFIETKTDDTEGIDGLRSVQSVTVSPDGQFVYAAGAGDRAIAVFARDLATGKLSFVEAQVSQPDELFNGLGYVTSVVVSPDPEGKFVYSSSQEFRSISVFERDSETGRLNFLEFKSDLVGFGSNPDSFVEIGEAHGIAVSPDGQSLYTARGNDDRSSSAVFARDISTGELTSVDPPFEGANALLRDGSATRQDNLQIRSIQFSSDGTLAYATFDNGIEATALGVFARDTITEKLTLLQILLDKLEREIDGEIRRIEGISGARLPFSVSISPDDNFVYVGNGSSLAIFDARPLNAAHIPLGSSPEVSEAPPAAPLDDADSVTVPGAPTPSDTSDSSPLTPPPPLPLSPLSAPLAIAPPPPSPTLTAPLLPSLPPFPSPTLATATGTDTADELTGSEFTDYIEGLDGDDLLLGGNGDDSLFGWGDNDELYGGDGNDFAHGGDGDDSLYGEGGDDTLQGGAGNDTLFGDSSSPTETGGNDILCGDAGDDVLFGQRGDDTLCGGEGDDTLNGGKGNDVLLGGEGNDRLSGDVGNDILIGNAGTDIFAIGQGSDSIQDFIVGIDLIELPSGVTFADLTITIHGIDTQFTVDGAFIITLNNLTASLTASNFI